MDLNEYCIQTDAFMTLSIYMANLFDAKNPDKLLMSIHADEFVQMPSIVTGTTKCIKFASKLNQFGFCYESKEVAQQIIVAYRKFYECSRGSGGELPFINILIEACDIENIDFTEKGPFGKDGPKYLAKIKERMKNKNYGYGKVDKSLKYDPMKLNKYYSLTQAPGTQ